MRRRSDSVPRGHRDSRPPSEGRRRRRSTQVADAPAALSYDRTAVENNDWQAEDSDSVQWTKSSASEAEFEDNYEDDYPKRDSVSRSERSQNVDGRIHNATLRYSIEPDNGLVKIMASAVMRGADPLVIHESVLEHKALDYTKLRGQKDSLPDDYVPESSTTDTVQKVKVDIL